MKNQVVDFSRTTSENMLQPLCGIRQRIEFDRVCTTLVDFAHVDVSAIDVGLPIVNRALDNSTCRQRHCNNNIIIAEMSVFNVAFNVVFNVLPHRDNIFPNKFRILKERHIQMRKLILL